MSIEPTRQSAAEWPTAQIILCRRKCGATCQKSWLGMIGHAERDDFATEEREHGTNQSKSMSFH